MSLENSVTFCPVSWSDKLNLLEEQITSLNYRQQDVSDDFRHLYVMLLDLKCNPSDFPEDYLQNIWMSLVDNVCFLFRGYFDDITDYPSPLFSIMLNLPNVLTNSNDAEAGFQNVIYALCDRFECQTDCLKQGSSSASEAACDTAACGRLVSTCEFLSVWCSRYGGILADKNILTRCIQVLEHMNVSLMMDPRRNSLQIVWERCQILLNHLFLGLLDDPARSTLSERDLLNYWKNEYPEQETDIRYLAVEGQTILCLMNPPKHDVKEVGSPSVYFIDRHPHRSISVHWLRYESDPLTEHPPPARDKPSRPQGAPVEKEELDGASVPGLDETVMGNKDRLRNQIKFLQKSLLSGNSLMEEHLTEKELSDFIDNQKLNNAAPFEVPPPTDLEMPECARSPDSPRMFLSHAGLLSPKMFESDEFGKPAIVLLKNSAKLQSKLETLDGISHKNSQTVLVLYVRTGQSTLDEIMKNTNVMSRSSRFSEFASSLGSEIVDICRFKGWTGLKRCNLAGYCPVTFPYYSNNISELIFIIPSLLPSKRLLGDTSDNVGDFKKLVLSQEHLFENIQWGRLKVQSNSYQVVVVWVESSEIIHESLPQSLASHFKLDTDSRFLVIFVHPLADGYVRIVTVPGGMANSGRVHGELVVRDNVSPVVVREECLLYSSTAAHLASFEIGALVNPRAALIDEIISEHQCPDRENAYFNCFFGEQCK